MSSLARSVAHLLAVVALGGDGRHVLPVERADDVDDRLRLEVVRREDAAEEGEARLVAQLGRRRGVADLRDLPDEQITL